MSRLGASLAEDHRICGDARLQSSSHTKTSSIAILGTYLVVISIQP